MQRRPFFAWRMANETSCTGFTDSEWLLESNSARIALATISASVCLAALLLFNIVCEYMFGDEARKRSCRATKCPAVEHLEMKPCIRRISWDSCLVVTSSINRLLPRGVEFHISSWTPCSASGRSICFARKPSPLAYRPLRSARLLGALDFGAN